jgi:hypothetical protein
MGQHIYKALGWGIDDVIVDINNRDNYKVTDPRFNPSSVVFSYENRENFTDEAYLAHIDNIMGEATVESVINDTEGLFVSKFMMEEMVKSNASWRNHMLLDGMIHQPLGNGKSVVLIIPPGHSDTWFHSNSPVDHYEAVADAIPGDSFSPTVKKLSVTPYPYSGLMNAKTGEKMDGPVVRTFLKITDVYRAAREDDRNGLSELALAVANKMGFESADDANENIVPYVPGDVRDLAVWTGLFTDENAWKDLRPMVITYWA